MSGELDLKPGADDEDTTKDGKPRGESERNQRRKRADIGERLHAIFSRLAESLEGRGDEELAGIIREDSRAMVGGLVSVTKRAPGLAAPIMGGLAVIEPLIAFGRILRLLARRLGERRAERGYEDALAASEAAGDETLPGPYCGEPGCEIVQQHRHEAAGVVYF